MSLLEAAAPQRGAPVARWIAEASASGGSHGWKQACWFWMAGWHADAECVRFFAEVLSIPEIRRGIEAAPETRLLWEGLRTLAG